MSTIICFGLIFSCNQIQSDPIITSRFLLQNLFHSRRISLCKAFIEIKILRNREMAKLQLQWNREMAISRDREIASAFAQLSFSNTPRRSNIQLKYQVFSSIFKYFQIFRKLSLFLFCFCFCLVLSRWVTLYRRVREKGSSRTKKKKFI